MRHELFNKLYCSESGNWIGRCMKCGCDLKIHTGARSTLPDTFFSEAYVWEYGIHRLRDYGSCPGYRHETKGVTLSRQQCKNKYFAELIGRGKVCAGMTPSMVEAAWGPAWMKDGNVWWWGNGSSYHSKVKFNDEIVVEIWTDFLDEGKPGYLLRA